MTKEIYERLQKYERQMLTAKRAKYYVGISPKDIETLFGVYNTLFPAQKEVFTTCNKCVLRVLSKLCDVYQAEQNKQPEPTPTTTETSKKRGRKPKNK